MKTSTITDPDVVRGDQLRKTETVIAREINVAYEQFVRGAEEVVALAVSLENRRIKLGALLDAAKRQVGHGKFAAFLKNHVPFSERTAQRFMKFAAAASFTELKNLDELKAYHALLIDWGLKPEPLGHGPQSLHDEPNFFVTVTKTLGSTRKALTDLLEARPLEEWDTQEREQLKNQIEPVASLYAKL